MSDHHPTSPDAPDEIPRASQSDRTIDALTLDDATPPNEGHLLLHTLDAIEPGAERYTLSHLHSKGGLGQVWLARDRTLGREVAFKEIRPERAGNPEVWARFVREARITGRLEHPSIVPVYELSQRKPAGQPFYTMRFIRGRTMREAIAAHHARREAGTADPLEQQTLLNALVGVANAVAYAHSKGVIHRDLKPDNVVLGDYGEVILLDWGLARAEETPDEAAGGDGDLPVEDGGTVAGQVLGTPSYMAPEQAAGRLDEVGPASDVYGLGAILYEILTSRPPVEGADAIEILHRAVHEPRSHPRAVRPETPPPLDAICMKALAQAPKDRYESAAALAEDVRRFLADEPVSAWREPWTRRAARWARRHRTLVSSAAVLLLAAVVALSAGTVLLGRKNREIEAQRGRAEENFRSAKGAVDRYLTQVADSKELKAKGLEELRTELFTSAREFYRKFVAMRAGDPAALADLASAHLNLGDISRQTGDTAQAESSYRKAEQLYASRFDQHPTWTSARTDLLSAIGDLALLYSENGQSDTAQATFRRATDLIDDAPMSARDDRAFLAIAATVFDNLGTLDNGLRKPKESEAAHEKGRALRQRLVELSPDNETYQNQLLMSEANLASLYATTGREKEALPHLEAAATIGEKLVSAHPDDPAFQTGLGATYNNLGGVYTLLGRDAEAREAHVRSLRIREKLAAEHPAMVDDQLYLAGSYVNLGELDVRDGRPDAALEPLGKAEGVLAGILAKSPGHAAARFYTAYALSWQARALSALGRGREAMRVWQRAMSTNDRDYPTIPAGYARELARRGDTEKAITIAKTVEKTTELPGEVLFDLAATYAVASSRARARRERYAAHAVELLGEAARLGYFDTPGARERSEADADLASIHDREDYRQAIKGTQNRARGAR